MLPFDFRTVRASGLVVACLAAGAGSLHGQTVTTDCEEDECHVVPIAGGIGGFVGRAKSGVEKVGVIMVCRGARGTKVVERELTPGTGGVVSALFGVDDGSRAALFCEADEDATIELRGLVDGGWFWLHDELNTAVAPLMAKDVLDNRKIAPVNPGSPDILIEANRAGTASFLRDTSTGRVGILPHVVPLPESDVLPCGPMADGELADGSPKYVARETGCVMGNGGTTVVFYTAGRTPITGGRVVRPATGEVRVAVALWLNGTGSVVHGAADMYPPTYGWPGIKGAKPLAATWEATLPTAQPPGTLPASAGIQLEDQAADDGYWEMVISASSDYCPAIGARHDVRVRLRASNAGNSLNPVRPPIKGSQDLGGAASEGTFTLACPPRPAASVVGAGSGRELAPPSGLDGP